MARAKRRRNRRGRPSDDEVLLKKFEDAMLDMDEQTLRNLPVIFGKIMAIATGKNKSATPPQIAACGKYLIDRMDNSYEQLFNDLYGEDSDETESENGSPNEMGDDADDADNIVVQFGKKG